MHLSNECRLMCITLAKIIDSKEVKASVKSEFSVLSFQYTEKNKQLFS